MQGGRLADSSTQHDSMSVARRIGITLLVLWSTHWAVARELRVPEEYGTIAVALQSLQNGDTIVLSPGIYVESLVAPPLMFMMRGSARLDSQATEFSIIDPTDLPGSDTLRIMSLTGGAATFQDLVFRNRNGMTDGRPQSVSGGIAGDTSVREVSFERCVFDSVVSGVSRAERITVKHCRFIGCVGAVYTGLWRGKLFADSTWFDGASGGLVTAGQGGYIRDCLFTHHGTGRMLTGLGDSLIIESCHFVGLDTLSLSAVSVRPRCNSRIRDCVFEDIVVGFGPVLQIADSCAHRPKESSCAYNVLNNRFVRCGSWVGGGQQGGEMMTLRCSDSVQGYLALLDSNRIDSTRSILGWASGLSIEVSCVVRNTVFGEGVEVNRPQMFFWERGQHDTVYFRDNSINRATTGILRSQLGVSLVDARENWWGHESGPFHAQFNPSGQGAAVGDGILFFPYLTENPDTSGGGGGDTSEVAREFPGILPISYTLSVYPNPFNATVTLSIAVSRAAVYSVRLYDVTGREAARVFEGRIEGRSDVRFGADQLASGVYFAQLSSEGKALATAKMLLLK